MKKKYLFISILFIMISSSRLEACAIASLFKVFPVGMRGDTIISVDMQIHRGMYMPPMEIGQDGKLGEPNTSDIDWNIKVYITQYDKYQTPLDIKRVDSVYLNKNDCEENIKSLYSKAYKQLVRDYKNIKLFDPIEVSFGNFEAKYKDVKIKDDQILYQEERYPIDIVRDSAYYGFRYNEYLELYSAPSAIGTVRKYILKDMELIVVHTQFGQKFVDKLDDPIIPFDNIESCAYLEPILYHGNGIDYFFYKREEIK